MTNQGFDPSKDQADNRQTPRHRTPLWVKGFLIAAAVLVVTFGVMHFSGGMVMNHTP